MQNGRLVKGRIYEVLDSDYKVIPNILVKIYRRTRELELEYNRFLMVHHIPGTVKVIGATSNVILMEKAKGEELFEVLVRRKKFPSPEIQSFARKILNLVKELDLAGIIHGDLKLENIMYDIDTCGVTLCDFEQDVHTLNYASPEYLSGNEEWDIKCEIWSIGVMLYMLFMGYNPYNGRNHILSGYPHHPMRQDIPVFASDLIEKMLECNPDIRITLEECLNHPWIRETKVPLNINDEHQEKDEGNICPMCDCCVIL